MQPTLPNHRLRAAYFLSLSGPARGCHLFSFGRLRAANFQLLFGAFRERTPLGVTATLFLSLWVCLFTAPDSFGQAPISTTFSYNGSNGTDGTDQTFTVPTGVNQLTVVALGAQGGSVNLRTGGGRVDAVMSVTAGQILTIRVGGRPTVPITGGYNGGGNTTNTYTGNFGSAFGGGGATDIRIPGTGLGDRVLVAGGGGGDASGTSGTGGDGGGLTGGIGGDGLVNGDGGRGGTQLAGGAGGATGGSAGTSGNGGNGVSSSRTGSIGDGGGGGGGFWGGGGGAAAGGGGSSYPNPAALPVGSPVTSVSHTQGARSGNGQLVISYQVISLSLTTQATPVVSGSATASVTATRGTGPYSYTWIAPADITLTPGNSTTSSVQAVANVCISGVRTLTVLVKDSSSPAISASATVNLTFTGVTVTITPTPSLTIAKGGAVTLTASGANSYTWSNSSTVNPLILPSVTSSTTLSVTGVSGLCSNTASAAVSVTANLSLSVGSTPVTNGTATASVTATSGIGPFSYTWIAPSDITLTPGSPSNSSSVQAAANQCISGVRTLTVIVEDGGANPLVRTTTTVNLTFAGVSVSITATPQLTIAIGGSVTLTASGATSYTWSDNSTANPLILNGVMTATTLSVTGVSGLCSNTASAAVMVVAAVTAATLSASTSVVCEGSTVSVVGSTTSPVTSYQWFKDGASLGGSQRTATLALGGVLPTQSGNYSLVVSDGITSATSGAFSLTVIPQPTVTLVFNGAMQSMLGPGFPLITLTSPINPNNLPFFQVFGGVMFERKNVIDRINAYEIRQVDTNTTGVFSIQRVGRYTITVTGTNGCTRTVEGMIESR